MCAWILAKLTAINRVTFSWITGPGAKNGRFVMDKYDDVSMDEEILTFHVPDNALERAALPNGVAWTMNYCTYNYYQCGPIGSPT